MPIANGLCDAAQSLQAELSPRSLNVQAVLPAATRTELWARSGREVDAIPGVMEVGELVDAALVGFDRRETITIPWLPDVDQWEDFATARQAMVSNSWKEHPPRGIARAIAQSPRRAEVIGVEFSPINPNDLMLARGISGPHGFSDFIRPPDSLNAKGD
jgi:hypothetical protein